MHIKHQPSTNLVAIGLIRDKKKRFHSHFTLYINPVYPKSPFTFLKTFIINELVEDILNFIC